MVGGKKSPNYPKENWKNIKKILKTNRTNINLKEEGRISKNS